ncbi:hypothetical protein V8C26DRAFT_67464 [Trichoderma gracile]
MQNTRGGRLSPLKQTPSRCSIFSLLFLFSFFFFLSLLFCCLDFLLLSALIAFLSGSVLLYTCSL